MKKEKIKAISKDFILFIFIAVMVFSIIAINPISNLDEIWNYNTARAITQNLIPYKDISMITTPLLPMITALFLKLIANEVIVSRVLASVLWGGVLFSIFKILKLLIKEENAEFLESHGVGIWIRKHVSPDEIFKDIFSTPEKLQQMKENTNKLAKKHSTEDICKICLSQK